MKPDARKNNGGARPGAGRKPNAAPKKYRKFLLTDEHYAMARTLGGSPWLQGQLNLQIKARLAAEKKKAEDDCRSELLAASRAGSPELVGEINERAKQ